MQVPKLPSFFKAPRIKAFNFKPRYYDERKEALEQLQKQGKRTKGKFFNRKTKAGNLNRSKRLVIILIALFLFFYLLLT